MPKPSSRSTVVASWWLSDGDEECPHCGRLYVYELEVRCTDCDGPACPHCTVTHARGHLICVGCRPSPADGEAAGD